MNERGRERDENTRRRKAMATLAAAPGELLSEVWRDIGIEVEAKPLRGPETGLVTLRGRFGEATVTRATVKLTTGEIGHSYALGSDKEKASISATIDALWQRAESRAEIETRILAPLRSRLAEADAKRSAETAATKVDFFTMVRGED